MIFKTENSLYELDTKHKRIRRVHGAYPPTPRQRRDGEWEPYYEISPVEQGAAPLIWWNAEGECTRLSTVKAIMD